MLLLVCWNVLLTGAIIWSLTRARVPERILKEKLTGMQDPEASAPEARPADSLAVPEARIAFFMMDSVQDNFELVRESAERVRAEGQRMEGNLQREMQKAEARYQELLRKDHTYSTQAELKADQAEVEKLGEKIQEMQASSQMQLDELQTRMLMDITGQIQQFLEEFNSTARYDYIFSIQDAGQIWVGNQGLDITQAVVNGLNAQHRARKAEAAK